MSLEPSTALFNDTQDGIRVQDIRLPDFFSDEVRWIVVQIVNTCIMGPIICTFGIVSNIFNIIIFLKLGFSDTVNISLWAMAVSDLISILFVEWSNVFKNPAFLTSDIPWATNDVYFYTSGHGHASFSRVTSWITAWVTFERCLCVMIPLKIKSIITAHVTVALNVIIYVCNIGTHLPEYATSYLGWKLNPATNETVLGLLFTKSRHDIEGVAFILSVTAQLSSFIAVILFTVVLIIQMRQKSKWRQGVSSGAAEQSKSRQKKDDRTVKMIALIAIIYIICYLPTIVIYCSCIHDPRISFNGQFRNVFFIAWSSAFLLEALNSSVNIFVYYTMSTKYRAMFDQLFPCFKSKDQDKANGSNKKSIK